MKYEIEYEIVQSGRLKVHENEDDLDAAIKYREELDEIADENLDGLMECIDRAIDPQVKVRIKVVLKNSKESP